MADTPGSDSLSFAEVSPAPVVRRGSRANFADVWSHTQSKYRLRALGLLILNLMLYCGLCVFTHWLHVARPFDFALSSYVAPARFWSDTAPNLNDFILYPISVEETPAHAVVLGLLVASIVSVPIVVSILYRLPSALPFVAAVFIFAHMPWMAFTLMASCILASAPPLRLQFRFGSALVGMAPVLLYLYLSTRQGADHLGYTSPHQSAVLAAPWMIAILAACAMMGLILFSARMTNYRPGTVAPVVAVMFATPVVLFHWKVGADELSYRVLCANYGPRAERFAPVQSAEPRLRTVVPELLKDDAVYARHRADFLNLMRGEVAPVRGMVWRYLLTEFLTDRAEAYEACKRFIADFPTSRYVPAVLYIQARTLDMRLDERKLPDLRRELYVDYAHVQSEEPWLKLATRYPNSPLAAPANLRLAELALRRGQVDEAERRLREMLERSAEWIAAGRGAPGLAGLEFEARPHVQDGRRLLELIVNNRDDPQFGAAPLRELAGLDVHRELYIEQVARLAQRYKGGLLYDNLVVRWASALPDMDERARSLEDCVERFSGDGLPEAMLRLADLETQWLGRDSEAARVRGVARLQELVARFGDTSWATEARDRLELLGARVAQAERRP